MDLVLEMCNTSSIHWCGISGRQLGKLSPGAFLSLPLTVLSSVQGLQVRSRLYNWPCAQIKVLFTDLLVCLPLCFRAFLVWGSQIHFWRGRTNTTTLHKCVWSARLRATSARSFLYPFLFLFFCILHMNGPTAAFCTWHYVFCNLMEEYCILQLIVNNINHFLWK